jgi:polyhydroxyalkanoate synthesis regulator phasin
MDSNDWLRQIILMGLGTTSLVAESVRAASEQWVKEGRINPDQAKIFVDDLMFRLRTEQGNFEADLNRQMRNLLQELGVPRQSEVDELRGRIDRLERQVRSLEGKLLN